MRRGFSLIEVLAAAAILALAIVPMISAFQQSGEALKQTLPYHQSVFLAEKAIEEVRTGALEDAHFAGRVFTDGWGTNKAFVVDGQHELFATLEDFAEPYGRILPEQDGGIADGSGPLKKQVATHALRMRAVLAAGPTAAVKEPQAFLTFDWTDGRNKRATYELASPFRWWVTLDDGVEPGVPELTDARLGEALRPGAGLGLSAIVASSGGQAAKMRAYARLLAIGASAEVLIGEVATQTAALEAQRGAAAQTGDRLAATGKLARLHEAAASELLGRIQMLRPDVEELAALAPGQLGTPEPPLEQRKLAVNQLKKMLETYFDQLARTLTEYGALASAPALPAGWMLSAHVSLLRASQLAALSYPWADRTPLVALCTTLEDHYRGRMPHVEHLVKVEKEGIATLETTYPLRGAAADVTRTRERFASMGVSLLVYGLAPMAEGPR